MDALVGRRRCFFYVITVSLHDDDESAVGRAQRLKVAHGHGYVDVFEYQGCENQIHRRDLRQCGLDVRNVKLKA